MSVVNAQSPEQVEAALANVRPTALTVLFFWASFHEPSGEGGLLDGVFTLLAKAFPAVSFVKVEADKNEQLAEQLQVHVIPTFLFVKKQIATTDLDVIDRLTGVNPRALKRKIKQLSQQFASAVPAASTPASAAAATKTSVTNSSSVVAATQQIAPLVNAAHVVLFMEGVPENPASDSSAEAVELLKKNGFKFGHYDVQGDTEGKVRLALKQLSAVEASDNSTAAEGAQFSPQLFVGGKLIGDHKVMAELHSNKKLKTLKPLTAPVADLKAFLKQLIEKDEVMLFMKGTPKEPRCGFSRKMVALLEDNQVSNFGSFNILEDEQVRQGLKDYSNWPTYPQLYVKGKLVGGLDIVTEMAEDDDLREALGLPAMKSLDDRIRGIINCASVVLVMKGSPSEPKCGFSRKAVALLQEADFQFRHFDILLDSKVRERIKTFSNFPTFPQLYIKGKLVGGLDIMKELHEDGELEDMKP